MEIAEEKVDVTEVVKADMEIEEKAAEIVLKEAQEAVETVSKEDLDLVETDLKEDLDLQIVKKVVETLLLEQNVLVMRT
jgi:hypothetical protein